MGTLFGFVVGYVVGARAGSDGFDEVVGAYRELRSSRELANMLGVLRHHARQTADVVYRRLNPPEEAQLSTIEKAMRRAGQTPD